MNHKQMNSVGRTFARTLLAVALSAAVALPAMADQAMSSEVAAQIAALKQNKDSRTSAQKKLDMQLFLVIQQGRGQALSGLSEVYQSANDLVAPDVNNKARVTITGSTADDLISQIAALGGAVRSLSVSGKEVVADMPLEAIEALAARADVKSISPVERFTNNLGALTSQGYISHKANLVNSMGYNGSGVKVGVISDSAEGIAALIASGDLPANASVLPGQGGPAGTSEGSAMMEIIADLAPGAQLIFATAYSTPAAFADNIRALRAAGCDIIVDDISYFNEGVFQDGPVAQAVNDVTAAGALYFSSAGNSGNVTSGTAGVWEGDFNPGAAVGAVIDPSGATIAHRFPGGLDYNVLTAATSYVSLKWSDPLGASTNDYDVYVLNSTGTTLLGYGANTQSGTQDPYELAYRATAFPAGSRIVIGNYANAAPRALHLNTNRGRLNVATSGVLYGHNAGRNTVSTAATYWNSAKTGTKAFVGGAANPTESFSSDGPRRIFYNPNGTQITPGNILFATNGGELLNKPDITAADGVSTKTPGFLPFYGTSAAAPHAAAVAALVKSARPDYTNAQILNAMKQTAVDIRAPRAWTVTPAWASSAHWKPSTTR